MQYGSCETMFLKILLKGLRSVGHNTFIKGNLKQTFINSGAVYTLTRDNDM
jgi:hypothetical protein